VKTKKTTKPTQEQLRQFVNREVFVCQSHLVEELLKDGKFEYEDITNFCQPWVKEEIGVCDGCKSDKAKPVNDYFNCFKCWESEGKYDNPQDVFEWWVVSDWLLDKLEANGQPVMRTDWGNWWGRTTTGQAILLDWVIEKIYINNIM